MIVVFKTQLDADGEYVANNFRHRLGHYFWSRVRYERLTTTKNWHNDGTIAHLVYDDEADILEIFFGENGPAIGIELTDQMILGA